MRTRKINSTNFANEKIVMQCPVSFTLGKIGGRWKPIVLWHLSSGKKRYSELKKAIPPISEKMLIETLKDLEGDQLIIRESKPVVPPFVEYSLSSNGKSLTPILKSMGKWGMENQ